MKTGLSIPLILCVASVAAASPRDDLSSPSQEVRDAAAKIVRETFVPTPREQWEPLVEKIKPEEIKDILLLKDRQRAGETAPPYALYLNKVYYEWD